MASFRLPLNRLMVTPSTIQTDIWDVPLGEGHLKIADPEIHVAELGQRPHHAPEQKHPAGLNILSFIENLCFIPWQNAVLPKHFCPAFFQKAGGVQGQRPWDGGAPASQSWSMMAWSSSAVKMWTLSQNWQVSSQPPCSRRMLSSSSLPRLMRARSTRSRLQ